MVGRRRGSETEARFLRGLDGFDVEAPGTDLLLTLDRRHFGVVRPRHCEPLRLLPES